MLGGAPTPDPVVEVEDHGHPRGPTGHVVDVRRLVDDLGKGLEHEAGGGDIDDRPEPRYGGAYRHAHVADLGYGRVVHTARILLVQFGHDRPVLGQAQEVQAHQVDPLVGGQLAPQRLDQRLGIEHFTHSHPPQA